MMKTLMKISTVAILAYLAGCIGGNSLLVTQADFDKVTNGIFTSAHFTRGGGGLSGGDNGIEFTAIYEPNDKEAALHFDFSAWDSFLKSKDTFSGHSEGGCLGLYWRETWDNRSRFIVIDAVAMKDGNIRVTYREILR